MKTVLFNDLQQQNIKFKKQFLTALDKVLEKGWLILGNEVSSFEKEFAGYIGTKFAIGVASGTDAIIMALQALELGPDDEVAIPVNVYPVAFAVAEAGVKLRLIDIDPKTHNMDPKDLASKITKKTKAVILVHLFGLAAPIREISAVAKKNNLTVIEDCSQAHGTTYRGKRTGSFGLLSVFSFYPTKNLGALGDGGIILTSNKKLAQKLAAMRQYGEVSRYESVMRGRVSRLDELQAAFLRIKLKTLDKDLKKRISKAKLYYQLLQNIEGIEAPLAEDKMQHTFHLYVVKATRRQELQQFLQQQGIQTGIHYPHLIHRVKPFVDKKVTDKDFPQAIAANKEILSLPFYPDISDADIRYVCRKIKEFYR
mgnify:CR=1 FL=1